MRTLLELTLSNAIVALVPAILAILVGLCCRRPALVHALWLLVLLKLLTPPLVRVSLPWPAEPATAAPVAPVVPVLGPPDGEVAVQPVHEAKDEEPGVLHLFDGQEVIVEAPRALAEGEQEPARASLALPGDWADWLGWLWLLGSAAWSLLALRRARSFSRALELSKAAPPELAARVARLARLVGLSRPPPTLLVPGRVTPMVWGSLRPVLLVPTGLHEQLGAEALDTLLVHELAHVRRRDTWVRALEFLSLGLFWWNPLAWYARTQLRQAEEQCCDAWVVRVMPSAARTYAVALVDALDFLSGPPPATPALACGIGAVADLKRRLKMILGKRTPHGMGRAGGLAVLALGVLLLPLMAAVSRADDEEQQDPKPKPRQTFERKLDDKDLDRLQQELKQRLEEVEQARKRLADAARRKAELDEKAAREKAEKAREMDRFKEKEKVKEKDKAGTTIVIQISGDYSKEEIEKLTATLQKALPGKDVKVMVGRHGQEHRFEFDFRPDGKGGFGWGGQKGKAPKAEVVPPVPPVPPQPKVVAPRPQPDRRVEELEKKLDAIIRELEAMKREMKEKGRTPPPKR